MDCQDLSLVEALLAEGRHTIIARHFDDAIPPLGPGLELLGQANYIPDSEDDTGQKLLLAEGFQRKHQIENAPRNQTPDSGRADCILQT